MAGFFGSDFDPTVPADTEQASLGASRIRDIKQRLINFMGQQFNLNNGEFQNDVIPDTALVTQAGVTPDSYTLSSVTVNAQGIITAISSGSAGSYKVAGAVELPATGGTGNATAPTNGQIPIGNSSNLYSIANLTAGNGITITNASGSITIAVNPTFFPQFHFYASATLTAAAAATPIQLLPNLSAILAAFSTRQVFLEGFLAAVNGATAWTTLADVYIQDTNGTPVNLVTIPVANLTSGAVIGPWTSGVVLNSAFALGLGATVGKGLNIVGNVNAGAGSNLIVQAWGVLE